MLIYKHGDSRLHPECIHIYIYLRQASAVCTICVQRHAETGDRPRVNLRKGGRDCRRVKGSVRGQGVARRIGAEVIREEGRPDVPLTTSIYLRPLECILSKNVGS